MRKFYLFLAVMLLGMSTAQAAEDYCEISSSGDASNLVKSIIQRNSTGNGEEVSIYMFTDETWSVSESDEIVEGSQEGGVILFRFVPQQQGNLCGYYDVQSNELYAWIYIVSNEQTLSYTARSGYMSITLDEDGVTYDSQYSIEFYSKATDYSETMSGVIRGICDEKTLDIIPISQEPTANNQKQIRDGQLLIERNGKTFNALGVEVR